VRVGSLGIYEYVVTADDAIHQEARSLESADDRGTAAAKPRCKLEPRLTSGSLQFETMECVID
jgi:hypothetical protein